MKRRIAALRCWSLPLRIRLVLLMLACTVPLLGLGIAHEYIEYRANVTRTGQEKLLLARSVAIAVDSELQRYITAMAMLSETKRLRDGDIPGFRELAKSVVEAHFPGANILLLREDGQQVMHTSQPIGVTLPVRKDLALLNQVFATGRPQVSDMFPGRVVSRNVIAIDVPVKDTTGRVVYALTINPPMKAFTEVVLRHAPPGDWAVTVFDRNGVTAGRTPDIERYFGQSAGPTLLPSLQGQQEGVIDSVSRDGIPRLAAFTHSPIFGWAVVIGIPRSEVTGPAIADALRAAGFGGASLLLSLALTLLMSSRIAQPIGALRRLATAGETDTAILPRHTGLPETDEVARALRAAQNRRQLTERRYRMLFDANPLAMCLFDLESLRFLEINEAMVRQYGWSREEILAMSLFDVHPPEEHAKLVRAGNERQRGYFNARQWRKDGVRFDVEASVRTVDVDGRKVGLAISHDVTDQILTRSRLAEAVRAFPGTFRLYDHNEKLVLFNKKTLVPNKSKPGIAIGDSIEKTVRIAADIEAYPASAGREEEWISERLAEFRRGHTDVEVKARDGRWQQLIEQRTADGGTISIRLDITARKMVEEQLRQSQKMETLGQLAGGVAHDFNNSLAVIMASLENIIDIEAEGTEVRTRSETALHATEQAASLTRRLLSFSRREEVAPVKIDVDVVLRDLQKILRSSVPRSIELATRLSAEGQSCVLDRTQLETAVMNLVVNARDAIQGCGTITVELENRVIGAAEVAAWPGTQPGAWVVVSVGDNGQGMSEDVQKRIFEPFYTTKEIGKGTGLGLSQIQSFVTQAGGFIRVRSAPGMGTRISLHFPSMGQVGMRLAA